MPAAIPEQETQNISTQRPHLVLLGAGASLAAFPNGERSGETLPLMQNLVDVLELQLYLDSLDIEYEDRNFEDVYSELHGLPEAGYHLQLIEQRVAEYFGSLKLPDEPTLYDYLVLSFREKDVIATFNWDPFLWQAANRNYRVAKPPHLLFLHGNVAVGFCARDKKKGQVGAKCSKCDQPFVRSKLLFPVKQKDYSSDPYINSE
jgi:hypothetical protein